MSIRPQQSPNTLPIRRTVRIHPFNTTQSSHLKNRLDERMFHNKTETSVTEASHYETVATVVRSA